MAGGLLTALVVGTDDGLDGIFSVWRWHWLHYALVSSIFLINKLLHWMAWGLGGDTGLRAWARGELQPGTQGTRLITGKPQGHEKISKSETRRHNVLSVFYACAHMCPRSGHGGTNTCTHVCIRGDIRLYVLTLASKAFSHSGQHRGHPLLLPTFPRSFLGSPPSLASGARKECLDNDSEQGEGS